MTAVVRVKRSLNAEPLENLVISCKKRKTTEDAADVESSAIFTFAGTVQSQDEDIFKHIQSIPTKNEMEENFKNHHVNIKEKLKSEKLQQAKDSRYKIVSRFRTNPNSQTVATDAGEQQEDYLYTIYDVEYDENQNIPVPDGKPEKDSKYVYDVYYTSSDDLGDLSTEDYCSIYAMNDVLAAGSARDNGLNARDSEDDSEDSNAENNWRNDYPDECDMDSIGEDDMIGAVNNLNLSDQLSTDDGEEDYVYYKEDDDDGYGYEDCTDDQMYRSKYERFMTKYKKQMKPPDGFDGLYCGDIESEDDSGSN